MNQMKVVILPKTEAERLHVEKLIQVGNVVHIRDTKGFTKDICACGLRLSGENYLRFVYASAE